MKILFIIALTTLFLYANSLESLLEQYKEASALWHLTKKDTAGYVDIYTRDELEKMQVYTLKSLLQVVPFVHYTYAPNGLNLFTNSSSSYIPPNFVRIYINDHDLSSSSFGSALLIWGEMPLEFIDHVEIYRGTASIEFGSETGVMVIKLYTKRANREEGRKVRVVADTLKSIGADTYIAHSFDEEQSLFFYVHRANLKSKEYENSGYKLKRGHRDFSFYGEYEKEGLGIEVASYSLDKDPFLGKGRLYYPTGGGLDARHSFVKVEKELGGVALSISYDHLRYDRAYEDESGVYTSKGYVKHYNINFEDNIFSIEAKRSQQIGENSLFWGGYYKYKGFYADGDFDQNLTSFDNALHLFSLYGEYIYHFDEKSLGILSVKGELYRYQKQVQDRNLLTLRAGYIRSLSHDWKMKAFLTKTAIAPQFFQQYSKENLPLITNPDLKMNDVLLALLGLEYEKEKSSLQLRLGKKWIKYHVFYSGTQGFVNDRSRNWLAHLDIEYQRRFSNKSKLFITLTKAKNSKGNFSPDMQCNIRLFNCFDKLDIYNELLYNSGYSYYGADVKSSLNYTVAMKYHFTPDFSIGLRGENLLDRGFKQAYRKTLRAYPVSDRKVLFNMEYTF